MSNDNHDTYFRDDESFATAKKALAGGKLEGAMMSFLRIQDRTIEGYDELRQSIYNAMDDRTFASAQDSLRVGKLHQAAIKLGKIRDRARIERFDEVCQAVVTTGGAFSGEALQKRIDAGQQQKPR